MGGNEKKDEEKRKKKTNIILFFRACNNARMSDRCRRHVHRSPRRMTGRASSHTGQAGRVELTDVIARSQRRDGGGGERGNGDRWGRDPNLAFLGGDGLICSPSTGSPSPPNYRASVALNGRASIARVRHACGGGRGRGVAASAAADGWSGGDSPAGTAGRTILLLSFSTITL